MKEVSTFATIFAGALLIPVKLRQVSNEKKPKAAPMIRPVVEILGIDPTNDSQYDRLGRQNSRTKKGDSQ
jgi:hypothetical protein